jgi:hypothetical protein
MTVKTATVAGFDDTCLYSRLLERQR